MKSIDLYIKESIMDGPLDVENLKVKDKYDITNVYFDDVWWGPLYDYNGVAKLANKIKDPVGPAFKVAQKSQRDIVKYLCVLLNDTPLIGWQDNFLHTLKSCARDDVNVKIIDETEYKGSKQYQIWYEFVKGKIDPYKGCAAFTLKLKK